MNPVRLHLLMAVSGRIYQGLVWLFPPAFRRAFGARMTRLFREQCRDTLDQQGIPGWIHLWRYSLVDMGGSLALEWGSTLYAGYTAGWPYHLMLALGMIVGFGALHTHTLQTLPLIVCVCASLFGVLQPQRVWEGMLRLSTGVALVRLVDGVIGSALPCSTYLLAIALATGASLLGAAFGVGVSAWLRRWRTWSLMT